jgi:hypothetical protein
MGAVLTMHQSCVKGEGEEKYDQCRQTIRPGWV